MCALAATRPRRALALSRRRRSVQRLVHPQLPQSLIHELATSELTIASLVFGRHGVTLSAQFPYLIIQLGVPRTKGIEGQYFLTQLLGSGLDNLGAAIGRIGRPAVGVSNDHSFIYHVQPPERKSMPLEY
jgi:hypothetical protein